MNRNTSGGSNFNKWLFIILAIILGGISIYLVIGSNTTNDILSKYNNLSNGGRAGITPKLQFLRIYTMATGDTTLALRAGLSEEEVTELVETGQLNSGTGTNSGGSGIIRPPVSGSWQQQLDALANSGSADAPHYNNQNFKIVNINGTEFIYESQNSQYPLVYGGSETVSGAGCFLFAVSAIISNKSGQIVSVADMMTKNGSMVTFNNNYNYNYPPNSQFNLIGSLYSAKNILSMYGLDNGLEIIASDNSIVAGKDFHESIESAIDNGYYVLYYCHDGYGILSSSSGTGKHWTVIVGYDDSNYYFLCNGGRSNSINKDTVKQLCRHVGVFK